MSTSQQSDDRRVDRGEATLAGKIAALRNPNLYPARPNVEARETHMSWVFLVGERVYKLKKPVKFPFLDFSTLARREAACRDEVDFNRRLAPAIYLGVRPLVSTKAGLRIGGDGPVVDWLVEMRRLPEGLTLEDAIRGGRVRAGDVERVSACLARFYGHARRVAMSGAGFWRGWRRAVETNRCVLADPRLGLPQAIVRSLLATQHRFLLRQGEDLRRRVRQRVVVDAHGDLRPEHIWLIRPVTIIDCLEFDAALRTVDMLDEIAFLHLECEALGAVAVGERVRRRLWRVARADGVEALFLFYRMHRAMVRARLSIAHLLDPDPRTPEKWRPKAIAYLRIAEADRRQLERLLKARRCRRASARRAGDESPPREAAQRRRF